MHIVQIYKDYFPVLGGIENHVRALSEGLLQRGHRVTVLVTSRSRRSEVLRSGQLTLIKAARLLHLASTPISPAQLLAARRLKADLAHLHFPYPPGDLVYRLLAGRPPLVLTYHSDIVRQRNLLQIYRPLMQQTLSQASAIIVSSPQYLAASPWLAPYQARCHVVPFGVDALRFAHADPALIQRFRERYAGPRLLFVGRLRYYKGLHFLLQALTELPGVGLLLAGSGPERTQLTRLAAQLRLGPRVQFLGDVADAELPALYAAADLFVLPAQLRAEAFGIVLIEALAAGVPLLTTELGTGTSFVNQHGRTGWIVPPGDVAALVRAIRVLLANPQLRAYFAANARIDAMTRFDPQQMLASIERIYASAVA